MQFCLFGGQDTQQTPEGIGTFTSYTGLCGARVAGVPPQGCWKWSLSVFPVTKMSSR